MSIRSICKTDVATIRKEASLKEVAELMQAKHVGSVIISDGDNGFRVPIGIVTDRDLALSLCSSQSPQEMKVDRIMQTKPVTIVADEGIYEAIMRMEKHGVKRLPVIERDGSLYGVVSSDDLLSLMGQEISTLARVTDQQIQKEQLTRVSNELQSSF